MADFEVTFVDVGHGDATLIKIPGDQHVLVDVYRCPGSVELDVRREMRVALMRSAEPLSR